MFHDVLRDPFLLSNTIQNSFLNKNSLNLNLSGGINNLRFVIKFNLIEFLWPDLSQIRHFTLNDISYRKLTEVTKKMKDFVTIAFTFWSSSFTT